MTKNTNNFATRAIALVGAQHAASQLEEIPK
jgi:hypothetical protein